MIEKKTEITNPYDLLTEAFKQYKKTNTDKEPQLPDDFLSAEDIHNLMIWIEEKKRPHEVELVLDEKEVTAILKEARLTYVDLLRKKGVHEFYLQELLDHVTPEEALRYIHGLARGTASVGAVEVSSDGTLFTKETDFTKRHITLTSKVIESVLTGLQRIKALDVLSETQLTALAIQYLAWHELSHSLQQAYINYHGEFKLPGGVFIRGGELNISKRANLEGPKKTIETEKQAQGLANDLLLTYLEEQGLHLEEVELRKFFQRALAIIRPLFSQIQKHDPYWKSDPRERDMKNSRLGEKNPDQAGLGLHQLTKLLSEKYPTLKEAINSVVINNYLGYSFPYKRKKLEHLYDYLRQAPTNLAPLRKKSREG